MIIRVKLSYCLGLKLLITAFKILAEELLVLKMPPPVLEIKPETSSGYRTLVRPCHRRKHLLIVNETYDSTTKTWTECHRDGKINLPLNYIKHICQYAVETDTLKYTKPPTEKELKRLRSPTAPLCLYYLPPVTVEERECESLGRATKQLFADTDDFGCRMGGGNYEEALQIEEEVKSYWDMTPTGSPELQTSRDFNSPCEPTFGDSSDEGEIPETPPASQCYAPKPKHRRVEFSVRSPELFD